MRWSVFLAIVLCSYSLLGQSVTFFTQNQNDFGGDKIFHEFLHEFPEGGFVSGYQVDYRTQKRLAYEYFNENGNFVKKFFPSLPYGNPQIGFTQAFKNKQVFVSGVGETANGNRRFSYCFDSTGAVQWSFNDSMTINIIYEETETNYFAQLHSSKDTGNVVSGSNLVRINREGHITWAKPFNDLYQQILLDTGPATSLVMGIKLFNDKYIFHLVNRSSFEYNKIAIFNKGFQLVAEQRINNLNYFLPTQSGITHDEKVGSTAYPRYKINFLDWDLETKWVFNSDSGEVNYLNNGGLTSIGRNFCFHSTHKDSSYKWKDEAMIFYNFKGDKVRECRYEFKTAFQYVARQSTIDGGLIFYGRPAEWYQFKVGIFKTDSLGLVYNTDIICDCKDFNVGVSEQSPKPLVVKVFPNPATDKINVLLSHQQKATITLHNLNGQIVHTQQAELNSNIVDISMFEAGVYIVEVESSSGSEVLKFVKQ